MSNPREVIYDLIKRSREENRSLESSASLLAIALAHMKQLPRSEQFGLTSERRRAVNGLVQRLRNKCDEEVKMGV